MSLIEPILQEFAMEMANTRKMIERIGDEQLDWSPHAKSMNMGRLVAHIAELSTWVAAILDMDVYDFDPAGYRPLEIAGIADALEHFDVGVKAFTEAAKDQTDEHLMGRWQMVIGGQAVIDMPRIGVIRGMLLNHLIHHRGQLSVYMRMNDIPLPALYGPSADEA